MLIEDKGNIDIRPMDHLLALLRDNDIINLISDPFPLQLKNLTQVHGRMALTVIPRCNTPIEDRSNIDIRPMDHLLGFPPDNHNVDLISDASHMQLKKKNVLRDAKAFQRP